MGTWLSCQARAVMKTLLVAAVLAFGCGSKSEGPDRWAEVEQLAAPTIAAADGDLLTKAIGSVEGDDVPEVALEQAVAWRKASGGLPWRAGRAMDDKRIFVVYKIGQALLERRAEDPEAVITALYLGQRLRAEAPSLIDVMVGFTLATKATTLAARPEYAAYAPTEAEVRRAIPADGLFFIATLNALPDEDQTIAKAVKRAYAELVVGAPADRAGYTKRVEDFVAKAEKSEVLALVISPRLTKMTTEMYDAIETYRAWVK
jgi:hypothetical protein